MALGGRGAEERDGVLTTYVLPPDDVEAFVQRARERLRAHTGWDDLSIAWRWQVHEDWAELWKRGLDVRRVGRRLVVHPSWLDPGADPDDLVIRLDPGMAFGTAEHGSTRGCLRLLEHLVEAGQEVLDVGCGSGILSIAAARLGAGRVLAVDIDPLACAAARANVRDNAVRRIVTVREDTVTERWLAEAGPFGGVVANLETHLLLPIMNGLVGVLEPDGWLVVAGVLSRERDRVVEAATDGLHGILRTEAEDRDGEWWCGAFRSPPAA